jgi:sugar/nucleoside kinase (ribokinase family)
MKLLLIGHSVEDHIFYKNEETIKPGGMYYSAAAMVNIKNAEDEIFLVTSLSDENYELFRSVYEKTDITFSKRDSGIIPRVRLDIYDDREREEKYDYLDGNLDIPLDKLNIFDGILINMITGFDITPGQIKEIRNNSSCPVYMDVHTLSRGVDDFLRRPQTVIKNFSEWAENTDIIQLNETEVFSLYGSGSETEIARRVLDTGTRFLIVTKGEKGARIYSLHNSELESLFISAIKVKARNKVGCGDIFGAVFFYSFIKFGDIKKAFRYANTAAGIISSYDNMNDISKLKDDVFA